MIDIRKEIEFWSLIMRDHAIFQYSSLSSKEYETQKTAKYFLESYEETYRNIKNNTLEISPSLIISNKNLLNQFIQFKKMLLTRLMKCDLELAMSPSFLNHMINEALEYEHILSLVEDSSRFNQVLENLRLHKIWLADASGHAKYIMSQVDGIEGYFIEKAQEFMRKFDQLFKKAYELYSIFKRIGFIDDGLKLFNLEVESCLDEFIAFLEEIEKLKLNYQIHTTGNFVPLIPNHMIREERYYKHRVNSLNNK